MIAAEKKAGHNPSPWPNAKRLLFVSDVQYHHDAINHTMAVVEQLGRNSGAFATILRTDRQMITDLPIAPQGKYADQTRAAAATPAANRPPPIPGDNAINSKALDYFDAVFLLPSGYGTMESSMNC